jgi:hypothetical protein
MTITDNGRDSRACLTASGFTVSLAARRCRGWLPSCLFPSPYPKPLLPAYGIGLASELSVLLEKMRAQILPLLPVGAGGACR